jgi:hypothetical protein
MVPAETISRIYWWLDAQERRAIARDKTTLIRAGEQLFLLVAVAVDSTEIHVFYRSDTRYAPDTF